MAQTQHLKIKEKEKITPSKMHEIRGARFSWLCPAEDKKQSLKLANETNLSLPIASVFKNRNLCSADEIKSFLFSSFSRDVASPHLMQDSQKAVERIETAIKNDEKILVFGDYDVDGITATSIALMCLKPLGANINYLLPNRRRDGYGISSKVVQKAHDANFSLIITVDNGITGHKAAEVAKKLGVDLIITDHHKPSDTLPTACAVVDPHRVDCQYPNKELCGAGVIFKIMSMLYENRNLPIPHKCYEILALGTIGDVVPLVHENRYWVREGLSNINQNMSPQICALAMNNKYSKSVLKSQDIAFGIVPQINALGRMDDPRDAVKFLLSSDQDKIQKIANKLGQLNEERKEAEGEIFESIEQDIIDKKINIEKEHVIFVCNKDWSTGLVGLVAGKLSNKYGRPAFVLHITKDGIAKGSCRSIEEFDVFNALSKNRDILTSFGGHKCAGGLSLPVDKLDELKKRLESQVSEKLSLEDLRPKIQIDAGLELNDANNKLMRDLELMEPFGNQNPVPTFIIKEASLVKPPQVLKKKHVKCMFFSNGVVKPAIFFNRPDLIEFLTLYESKKFNIAAQVTQNEWRGNKTIELLGLDIALNK
ncbi:single-stranded-DNA-specific exonuclease RecJ [Candidatus Dependentiae bacterium]